MNKFRRLGGIDRSLPKKRCHWYVVSHDILDDHLDINCQDHDAKSPQAHQIARPHSSNQVAVVTLDHQHRCAHLSRQQMDVGALG